jgi:hypothetical protein
MLSALFVFFEEAFEQHQVFFLIAQQRDAHILRHVIASFGGLNDFLVMFASGTLRNLAC